MTDSAGNGATTSADGQGGNSPTGYAGGPAGSGTTLGGVGVTNGSWGSGGGGGGGYYGGGGGQLLQVNQNDGDQWEVTNYAGGGGSSYVTPAATNVSYPASATPANGSVTITYNSPVPAVSPVNNETFTYDAQDHVTSETTTAGATTTVVTYSLDALERVVQREVTVNGTVTEDDQYGYANGGAAAISVTNLLGSGGPGTTTTTAPTTTTSSSTTTTAATTTTTHATATTTAPTTTTTTAGGGTISSVGSLAYASGSATTLSVSPKGVGDLMTLVVSVTGGPVSSVSGGGVTTWSKDIAKVGNQEGNDNEIWWGVVSATGASTVTVAFGGSHSDDELMAQEYSAGAGATWSAGANGSTSSTTSTVTFPSLTPSGSGELYLGFAQVDGSGEAGSTPGFSYTITSAEGSVLCWDTNVSSATSPTATQTGSGSDSVGALLVASGGGGGTTTTTAPTTTTSSSTTTTAATTTTTHATTTTTAPTTTTTTAGGGTISSVGSLAYASGSATTLSVSPKGVGDLMTLVVSVTGGPVSSVSGGGVTTWSKDIAKVGNQEGNDNEIWWGVVSATGASTVTVAFGGSHSDDELMAQEYSAGAGATWSAGANGSTSSTTSTVTFPSLTPSGSGELYLGFAQVDGSGEAGSTPGFSYTITSAEGSVLCWDTNVSSATSPTATQTGSGSDSVGALLVASGGGGGTTTTGVTTTTTAPTTTTTTASGSRRSPLI